MSAAFGTSAIVEIESFIGGLRMLDHAPELEMLIERNAGLVIMPSLTPAGVADDPSPPAEPVPLSINALATTFAMSPHATSSAQQTSAALAVAVAFWV